ncbi:hypothetical protein VSQ48_18845 [Candidatus Ventrimonas sp. KK005]|jgi:hypothetical protein|nr:hypothetical protein [Lachnospiraceae bacterium]NBH18669.1 hypothetical protein [Clostridiaceae bacterium]
MGKIRMILASVFLGGVILGGIGAGIAIVEYSSLTYVGEKKIGEENLVTCEMDYTFTLENEQISIEDRDIWNTKIEEDETVPEGTIRYVVTYNEKTVKPTLRVWEEQDYQEEDLSENNLEPSSEKDSNTEENKEEEPPIKQLKQTALELGVRYTYSDFALLMESKDQILEDLRQGRIASYDVMYISQVTIKVNPRTMPYIETSHFISPNV